MPARPTALVPVTIEAQPGAPAVSVEQLVVEASHDDGETWTEVPVTGLGHGWLARIRHDPEAQFVSLRATATDEDGNTVEQTTIRAYELAERTAGAQRAGEIRSGDPAVLIALAYGAFVGLDQACPARGHPRRRCALTGSEAAARGLRGGGRRLARSSLEA